MKKVIIAAVLLTATTAAFAQEPSKEQPAAQQSQQSEDVTKKEPSADQMQQIMEQSLGAMAPMMGKMAEAMLVAQVKVAEMPETAKALAKFKKNLYDELLRQGFPKKEAMEITITTAIPGAVSGMK